MSFRPHERLRRLRMGGVLLALALLIVAAAAALERRADAEHVAARVSLVAWLGTADLALSSSSRWLRHPSQAEPGAASADMPAGLDVDPAGASIAPPREVIAASARDAKVNP